MIMGVRIPSASTTNTLAPQSLASSLHAGDGFVFVLNATSVTWYPVPSGAESDPKEQFEQGSSNGAVAQKPQTQTVLAHHTGNLHAGSASSSESQNESVEHEELDSQDKSNRKSEHPSGQQASIIRANGLSASTTPIPQVVEATNQKPFNVEAGRVGSDSTPDIHPQAASNGAAQESNKPLEDLPPSANASDSTNTDDLAAPSGIDELQGLSPAAIASVNASTLNEPLPFSMPTTVADKQGSSKLNSGNPDAAVAIASGVATAGDATNGSGKSSAHIAQGTPAESSQSSVAAQRVSDIASSHSHAETVVIQSVSSQASIATRTANTPIDASHSGGLRQTVEASDTDVAPAMATSAISDARLMQTMNESQMRIGLSSNAFGDISIRTSISGHQLVAQISLDHGELSQAMTAQVSSVQTKLNDEHGLHALIEINHHSSPQSADAESSSQRERSSATAPLASSNVAVLPEERSSLSQETNVNADNETRLDIRA